MQQPPAGEAEPVIGDIPEPAVGEVIPDIPEVAQPRLADEASPHQLVEAVDGLVGVRPLAAPTEPRSNERPMTAAADRIWRAISLVASIRASRRATTPSGMWSAARAGDAIASAT